MTNSMSSNSSERLSRPHPMLGAQIGQYRILDVVGGGGMGIVFRARQEMVDRDVALKLLPPELAHDEINSKRLEREAKALAKLNHPNIVTTYDFGLTQHGQAYLVMELVDGESLKELLLREGRMDLNRAVRIFIQMADAMRFAHQNGIIHRDLKPHNVMIAQAPSADFVKVLDFGIARLADSQKLTRVGEIIGSPLYMSPEQCLSEPVDHRTDIYALGVLMYVCLTGHVPFKGDTLYETVERKCTMPPPRFADIVPELDIPNFLEELIRHCLAVEKEDRFQTMDEVKGLLESVANTQKKQKSAVAETTSVLNGPVAVPKRPAPPPKTIKERMTENAAAKVSGSATAVPPKLPRQTVSRGSASRPARTRPISEAKGVVLTPGLMALAVISLLACMLGGMYLGIKVMDNGTFLSKSSVKSATASGAAIDGGKSKTSSAAAATNLPPASSKSGADISQSSAQNSTRTEAVVSTQAVEQVSTESGEEVSAQAAEAALKNASNQSRTKSDLKLVSDTHTIAPPNPDSHKSVSKIPSREASAKAPRVKQHSKQLVRPILKRLITKSPSPRVHKTTEPTTESVTGVGVHHVGGDPHLQWEKFSNRYQN
jgi:serine/threonine protein kinase